MLKDQINKLQVLKARIEMLAPCVERMDQAISEMHTNSLIANPKYADPRSLMPHRFKLFSQFGQDGFIAEIFKRIGVEHKRFVEVGVAPLENNTGFLLLQGWSGLWLDAAMPQNDGLPPVIKGLAESKRLAIERGFITKENIKSLLANHQFDTNLDFVGVDIDQNTYHVFEECLALSPRVVAAEYNSQFPASFEWVAPYDGKAVWDETLAYGASLKSLEKLAAKANYSLVGCELSGTDAFFVRNDLLGDHFHAPFTSEHHWEPLRRTLDVRLGHRIAFPTLYDGKDR